MKKYQKRFLCYMDILGFKNLIQSGNEYIIFDTFNKIRELKPRVSSIEDRELYGNIKFIHFSDTIIISTDLRSPVQVCNFFELVQSFQFELFKMSILVRGGIVYGDLLHTKDYIFGHALINAYNLESKLAKYPRILIDEQIINWVNKFKQRYFVDSITFYDTVKYRNFKIAKRFQDKYSYLTSQIVKDIDNCYYLNYLDYTCIYYPDILEFDMSESIERLYELIISSVFEHESNENVLPKYLWLGLKYNQMIEYFKSEEFIEFVKANRDFALLDCIKVDYKKINFTDHILEQYNLNNKN